MYLFVNKKKIEIIDCLSFSSRLMGFMFQKDKIKASKRFPKCNSIHTFFMKQEIDVIMTDMNNKIVKIFKNLNSNDCKGKIHVGKLAKKILDYLQFK